MSDTLPLDGCEVDLRQRTVRPAMGAATLTTREAELLRYLADRAGRDIPREELLTEVWGYREGVQSRTIDTTVQRLRRKIERDPSAPRHLLTVQGLGYRFEPLRQARPQPAGPSFHGRADELSALSAAFEDGVGFVTLLGPGGAGKTRLSRRWAADAAIPTLFCDLAAARDGAAVVQAVAATLGLPPLSDDPAAQVGRALAGRGDVVLILDNFEQAVDAAPIVGRWVDAAPSARVLVTSRIRLQLRAERVIEVGPLHGDAATRLFEERAKAARPGFELDDEARAAVVELCEQLDGLPLAIELAAARVTLLSPAGLLERLGQRFRLLVGSRPNVPKRHQALRRTIEWSWELLEPTERRALAWCSVFEGGFDADAAEAVLVLPDDGPWVLDLLEALRDRSLLRLHQSGQAGRLQMLESIRQYAGERLDDLGERDAAEAAHRAWFLEQAELELGGRSDVPPPAILSWLGGERANLFAAWRSAPRDPASLATLVRLALVMHPLLTARGPFGAHLSVLDEAVAAAEAGSPRQLARILGARCSVRRVRGLPAEAASDAARMLDLARAEGDAELTAEALHLCGAVAVQQGRPDEGDAHYADALRVVEDSGLAAAAVRVRYSVALLRRDQGRRDAADACYRDVLAAARRLGDVRHEALALGGLGLLAIMRGDMGDARELLDASLTLHGEVDDRRSVAVARGNLAMQLAHQGDVPRAAETYDQARRDASQVGDRRLEAMLLRNLAILRLSLGRVGEAETDFREALQLHRGMNDRWQEGRCLSELAEVMVEQDRLGEAERTYREGLAIAQALGDEHGAPVMQANLALCLHLQRRLDEAVEHSAPAVASLRESDDAWLGGYFIAYGGALRAARGELEIAQELLDHAESRLRSLEDPAAMALHELCAGVLAAARGDRDAAAELAARGVPEAASSHAVRVARRLLNQQLEEA